MARILENASECNCEIRAKSLGGGGGRGEMLVVGKVQVGDWA